MSRCSRKKPVDADHMGNDSACENTPSEGEEEGGKVESCCVCGSEKEVRRCGKCKFTSYCSKACQWDHWNHHEVYCNAIVDLKKLETKKLYHNRTVRQIQTDYKSQKKMMNLVGNKPMINCRLGGKDFEMLWDTGSMVSLVDRRWARKNFPDAKMHSVSDFLEEREELSVRAANSTAIQFDGVILLEFSLEGGGEGFLVPVVVASAEIAEPILGYNVIEYLILEGTVEQQDALRAALKNKKSGFSMELLTAAVQERASKEDFLAEVKSPASMVVPAGRRVQVRCRVKAQSNDAEQTVYFSPLLDENDEDLTFLETVSQLRLGRTNYVSVEVMNLSKEDKVLEKGRVIGSVHGVSAVVPMMRMVNVDRAKKRDEKTADVGCVSGDLSSESTDGNETQVKWDISHLDENQREMMEEVLVKMKDVFSKDEGDIGNIEDFKMPIHVEDQIPVNAAYRKIPPNLYKEVKNYIEDLLTNGWIQESYSSYSSPIVCVRKKDGTLRMCCDYRKLNQKTVADSQPIPRIQDILDSLGGQKVFTTLDMSKAYHQGYIDERHRHLTAFVTPWTLYEWIRIPFGLRNAPPAFQRYMNQVLGDLKGIICEPYLDDVLVYSRTFEQHVKDVEKGLMRLHARGIKLRAEKCKFGMPEVRYLGRLISSEGYRPDPADTECLEAFRTPPKTVGELRSLLGFIGYYRCYVKDFSKRVKPMYDLLRKDGDGKAAKKEMKSAKKSQKYEAKEPIIWEEVHQDILNELLDYLKSPEVIAYPNFDLPFFINCDASNQGLGAVLYQEQEGIDRVIGYASRTLSEAEKNYHWHSGKLEFLGLKWAVTDRFADYLRYGPPFKVFTDNNPLTYVLTTAKLNAVGQRWVNDLADFNFTIKYKPGKENIDADCLSRKPMSISEFKKRCTATAPSLKEGWTPEAVDLCPVMVGGVNVKKLSLESDEEVEAVVAEDLARKQQQDETIAPVYKAVSEGKRLSRKEGKALSRSSKLLLRNFGKLFIRNGVLMRKTVKYEQVVLPSDFYHLVYVELHEKLAHLGVEKVVDLAQRRFYWPKMADDIKNYIQKKCRCVANKKPNQPEKAKLVPIQAMYPFQMVSIDYMHLDPCKGNYKYAMVVTDHFTRFAQVYATKSKSSKAAAQKLYDEYMMQFGFPERLHHDQGPEFNSDLFKQLERLTGIKGSNTTPYHPQGDGQAERFNRTLCNMLKCLPEVAKKDWKNHLPKLAFAYNSSINKTTGFSPFRLMFNRESRLPIDQMFEGVRRDERLANQSHEQYISQWEKAMQEAVEIARKNIGKSAEYSKRYYDKKVRAVEIVEGDRVLMKNVRERGGTGKMRSYWEETLFTVIETRENVPVYTIKNMKKPSDVRVVHRNLLLKCDELPLDIFDDKGKVEKTGKPAKRGNNKKKTEIPCECPSVDIEEEEDADIAVMIHHQETIAEPQHPEESFVESESDYLEEVQQVEEEEEEHVVPEPEEDDSGEEEAADEETESDVEESEGSDEEDPPIRRSTRNRTAAKRFTYSTIGGDPTLAEAVT